MEKIDLNNYEAYFLDLMEGALSAEEKHDLFAFLELHPQLKAEMESDFGSLELEPQPITFEDKAQLKIDESELILTANTVGEIMIASVEGQLTAEHEAQLAAYAKANQLEKTLAYYKATLLKADMGIVYPEKQKLKVKTGIIISLPLIARIGAIAAVGIILLTVAFRNWDGDTAVSQEGANEIFASTVRSNSNLDFKKIRNSSSDENSTHENEDGRNNSPIRNEDFLPDVNDENMAMEEGPGLRDTSSTQPVLELPKVDIEELNNNHIVEKKQEDLNPIIPEEINEDSDVVLASVETEEPYKIVTNAASNLMNRDVKFTRDRNVSSNEYVSYGFKVGKFEFERKKSR